MTSHLHPTIIQVTDRIRERSAQSRQSYLARTRAAAVTGPRRLNLSCGNLAHGFAACSPADKQQLAGASKPNIAIISAYNDMLSAHQPYETYPRLIKSAVRAAGGIAQFAGGVPAMCDGITQGQSGMELSLFSRDVIAMAAAIALSHDMFDGAVMLGVCDKIVPGLLIGALSFGHLPFIFIPAGPMSSGISNDEKARVRMLYAKGEVSREDLLRSESQSYHSPGTCTFYGTANSNQMLVEIMGLHLPGASFVNPGTPLRDALTDEAAQTIVKRTAESRDYTPISEVIDERSIVNGVVGLLATGGSTNHTLHLIAIAQAAGLTLTWDDFSELSTAVPLLARVYPNGKADINHFQAAGGMAFLIGELLDAGLLHPDVKTMAGAGGLQAYRNEPILLDGHLSLTKGANRSLDTEVLRPAADPFSKEGGLAVLDGNLGRAVIKTSAVKPENRVIEAPARLFTSQEHLQAAFKRGELHRDFVAVVIFQGPAANGMPELHNLTPPLSVLQDLGYKVALVTDGRMSGASGKVPAAIHVTPEAINGGPLARLRDGDIIRLDAEAGILQALVDPAVLSARPPLSADLCSNQTGTGRELFNPFRSHVGSAETGASIFTPKQARP